MWCSARKRRHALRWSTSGLTLHVSLRLFGCWLHFVTSRFVSFLCAKCLNMFHVKVIHPSRRLICRWFIHQDGWLSIAMLDSPRICELGSNEVVNIEGQPGWLTHSICACVCKLGLSSAISTGKMMKHQILGQPLSRQTHIYTHISTLGLNLHNIPTWDNWAQPLILDPAGPVLLPAGWGGRTPGTWPSGPCERSFASGSPRRLWSDAAMDGPCKKGGNRG